MRSAALLCLFVWLTSAPAHASMWMDPEWEQMLKESELIALVEVIEGGKFVAKVRPLGVFKGKIQTDFYVAGFNNHNWPKDAIKTETFGEKQRYYLFLVQGEEGAHYLEFSPGWRVIFCWAAVPAKVFSNRKRSHISANSGRSKRARLSS